MLLLRLALLFSAFAFSILVHPGHIQAGAITEGFEGKNVDTDINHRFKLCRRPENSFRFSSKARSGRQSLELKITPQPLFAEVPQRPQRCASSIPGTVFSICGKAPTGTTTPSAPSCGRTRTRTRISAQAMPSTNGFSMWVDGKGVPRGDFNRLVLGQWKATCRTQCDGSPFLAQRLTGRFYHITLDVDAKAEPGQAQRPKTCKILLAFSKDPPSKFEPPLALDRPTECETRLQWPKNEPKPAEKIEIKRERYLPNPLDSWTDLVFRVEGGKTDGVIQVWAQGQLIATAKGWIGHRISEGLKQYFKFGPYRDPAGYPFTVYLDNLARGGSYDEVDPARF
jgi:Polysaccharide lyase